MKNTLKQLLILSFWLLPWAVFAQDPAIDPTNILPDGLGFTPVPNDLSVSFLGSIFGVVDGVLQGSSQLLGQMFGVFNSAALTLVFIIGGYVLLVSTLNSAQQGEVLGQRWSSIWIPGRLVLGVALLIPRATGYNTLQVLLMYVVVQGVGAADAIWNTILGYVQSGGVIVEQQISPTTVRGSDSGPTIKDSAYNVLLSEVCMLATERELNDRRQRDLDSGAFQQGDANDPGPVPSFEATISNVLGIDEHNSSFTLNFPDNSNNELTGYYERFAGACGHITWQPTQVPADFSSDTQNLPVFQDTVNRINQTRSIAVQQMVLDLLPVARSIVNNFYDNLPGTGLGGGTQSPANRLTLGYLKSDNNSFPVWDGWDGRAPLLRGSEIRDAAVTYQDLVYPALRGLSQDFQNRTQPQFIQKAAADGWISAGQYYFDLTRLNEKVHDIAQDQTPRASGPETEGTRSSSGSAGGSTCPNLTSTIADETQHVQDVLYGDYEPFINTSSVSSIASGQGLTCESWMALYNQQAQRYPEQRREDHSSAASRWIVGTTATAATVAGLGFSVIPGGIPVGILVGVTIGKLGQAFADLANAQQSNVDPLVSIARFGNNLLNLVTLMWIVGGISTTAITLVSSVGACLNPVPYATLAFLMWFLPLWTFLMGIFFTAGISMSVIVPLMPYLIFTFAAIGWFVSVIESMIAAPLVGLALVVPEGNEALGRSANGIMLILGVFLRPSLMLFGFVTSIILVYVGVWLFNTGFLYAAQQAFGASSAFKIGVLFQIAGFIFVYFMGVLTIVNKSFTMIHVIPDRILRWLGGGYETFGQEFAGSAGEIRSGFQQGASQAGGALQSRASSGGDSALQKGPETLDPGQLSVGKNKPSPGVESGTESSSSKSTGDSPSGKSDIGGTTKPPG
ncbi:MAG: hypothetical protein Tsb005_10770 [Gammaproteobacteria bacterium]